MLNLMIFRTKNHKIPTSAKVVSSLSFFRCFGGYFGTFGHMSVWSGKRKEMDHILRTTWTTSGPTEAEEARAEARAGAEEARAEILRQILRQILRS